MKGFFSRLNGDIQASSSKPTKESSYKFWIPSNTDAEKSPPKTIPVHPDVAASHSEKRSRPLKSAHPPKIPLHDLPTAPLETQAIHTNDMSRYTSRPNPGTSSTPYSQNHLPAPSRTPRPHEHNNTRYQAPSREAHVPAAYPTGSHTLRETSSKLHRGERRESVAPVPREVWLPSTTPAVSKQVVEGQRELHVRGTSEKPEQYRESGDHRDRVKELERRGKDRDRDRREKDRDRERGEKGRIREREREERERERSHAKERQERETARAKREEDRNLEIDRGREHDKYTQRDQRDLERDSDREGKNRTKDRSKKESSNLTRGMERTWDSDVPYDGERTKQDERRARRRDRTTEGDNRESHKERDRWLEKEPERARERLRGQVKHRSEATDGEQFTGRVKTPAPDRETRKDSGVGWFSDTHTGHSRKLLRKTSNTLLNQPARAEEGGDSSDSSTRPNRVPQVLKKRQRGEEGGSSSKIIHSRQGMPTEPLASTTKSSVVKATIVTIPDDVHLPVPPTPQHMPIHLPPKESTGNAIDSSLPLNIAPLNVVSARAAEARETVNRLKSHEPLTHTAENVSNPREVDTSIIRRPPSRGPTQPPNPIPSHPMVAPSVKGTRGSAYIQRPKYPQPIPTIVHDKLQTPGLSLLPEMAHTSTQAEGSKDPNHSLERLPDSIAKKEVPSVFYKVQHRIPPQGAGTDSSRHPTASTPQNSTCFSSTVLAPPNLDPELSRKVTQSFLHQGGSNMQTPTETNPSYNLQLHNRVPTVMSGNSVVHEAHLRMGTPVAQVVLGKVEPMNPPSDTTMQKLQSAPLNLNVIQDSGISSSVSKTNKIEAVTQPKNEVPLSSIERSQFHTELSINRPSTAMDCKSLGNGLAARPHLSQDTDISKAYPLLPGWRNNVNIISNTLSDQEMFQVATPSGIALNSNISPSMSSQPRSNGQESIGIAITRPSTTTGFRQRTTGKNLRHHNISLSHSDAQNSIGISVPRPSTATAIKQSSSGPSPRQTFNATSHTLNPVVEEAHSNIFSPSIARHDSILAPNPQPVTLPITEKGLGLPAQPYNITPSAGLSLGRGDATVLQEDVTGQRGASGSHRQGHADGAADLNVISHPENFTSQALNPKLDNLRNATTPLAGSIPTSKDNVPSASPSAVIVPQIQIHRLITTTGTENKSESLHTQFHADASMPCIPGVGAGLEVPVVKRLPTPNPTPNVFPIQIDQPQLHRSVHIVPKSMTDANVMRPSINERALTSHAEDSRFKILRVGSSQEATSQTVVNNHSATLSSYQSDPASSATVQNVILNMQMDNDPAQASPSLGFFNSAFSEVLHSHAVRRSGLGDYMATKVDGKIVSAVFETDKDVKTSESLVNRDTVRNVPKEPPDVPLVERLITQKDSHTDIHSSKVASPQIPSEVNRSSKFPSPPSHRRIQHPGLAEILSSPFYNDQPPTLSAAHDQYSTVFSKSGSSPKPQGSLDKQRPDDKLVSPKSSPSRQLASDLRHKEVEQHHEPSKRQQQTTTTTSRSAHLEILLSDPRVGDSRGLTPSNVPSSSHPSTEHQPRTTSTIPDGITPRFLESIPHVSSKRPGQSGASYPEVPISTGGPPQMDELVSRKIQPPSIVDSKPLGNGMTHYRAATPLRESTSTTRHQHSMSLPVHLVPSANVPSVDAPLRSASHIPLNHHSTSQTKPGYIRPPDPRTLALNKTSDSEETILMTPSSLARSVMLKPTVSRQSVTPSISSQKGTGLFTMFRSRTPAQPRPQYEIWHPNASSKTPDPNVASSDTLPEQKRTSAPTPVPVTSAPIAIERSSQKSKIFTPFRYLTTKRNRAVSLVSVEAQDGTAPSTVVGSPTASMLSQAPFQPPPVRDPMQATEEWRHKEDETYSSGKPRIQRPGVVFDVAEDRPDSDRRRQRPKRTRTRHKSSRNPS